MHQYHSFITVGTLKQKSYEFNEIKYLDSRLFSIFPLACSGQKGELSSGSSHLSDRLVPSLDFITLSLDPFYHSHNNSVLKSIATLRWFCRWTTRSSPRAPRGAAIVKFIIGSAGFSFAIRGIDRKGLEWRGWHCLDLRNNHLRLHGVFFEFAHALLSQGCALLRLEGASFSRG